MNLLGFTCLKETFAENTGRLAMKTSSYLGFNQSQSLPTPLFRSTHLQTMQTLENGPCAWRSLKKSSDDHIPRPPSNCDVPFLNSNVCLVTSRNRVSLLFASRVHIYIYMFIKPHRTSTSQNAPNGEPSTACSPFGAARNRGGVRRSGIVVWGVAPRGPCARAPRRQRNDLLGESLLWRF